MPRRVIKKKKDDRDRRSKNFTQYEKKLLIGLAEGYKNIIENKHTGATTNHGKNASWDALTVAYNASNQSGIRSTKQLKDLYKVLKKSAKSYLNNDRMELHQTDGGTFVSQSTETDFKLQEPLTDQATENEEVQIPEERAQLLDTGKEMKKIDLKLKEEELKNQQILFNKRLEIMNTEAQIKGVELEIKTIEKKTIELDYKIKLKQYESLNGDDE